MPPTTQKTDGTIYALKTRHETQPVFVIGCQGSADRNHRKDLAASLRGEERSKTPDKTRLDWISSQIVSGNEIEVVVLQTDVSRTDLAFFTAYWASQFPGLKNYPNDATAPDTITDAGRKALGR